MSWSFYIEHTPVDDFVRAAEAAAAKAAPAGGWAPEVEEQIQATITAAESALYAITPDQDNRAKTLVGGTMHGHANPDHLPTPGMANDTIGFSLQQVSVAAAEPKPEPAAPTPTPEPAAEPTPEAPPTA